MTDINLIKELALHSIKGTAPSNFSKEQVDKALLDEFSKLAGSVNQFRKNRYDIYEIIMDVADEIVPRDVMHNLAAFADVRVVPQGQTVRYRTKLGRQRAKSFLTQVGLAGVYETFRLDATEYEVKVGAVGGAVTLDFERFLDGAESLSELMAIITEGMVESVFYEVQKALRAAYEVAGINANNSSTVNTFDAAEMERLVNVVRAYGQGVTIFAPPEFISAMGPDAIVPVGVNTGQGVYPTDDINQIHETGFIRIFRGAPVVMLQQSFSDTNNEALLIDPQLAYILPTGGEKVVKVVLEGNQQISDHENRDWSFEIHTYRKMGVAINAYHNWGIYKNTSIEGTFAESPYGI